MPLPKRRKSISKKNTRRSHDHLAVPQVSNCTNPACGETHLPHHVCPACGFYKGRLVAPHAAKEK
ncbi:MAG: 50S ribosomal protein L32 [Desulfobaccales bacterium]